MKHPEMCPTCGHRKRNTRSTGEKFDLAVQESIEAMKRWVKAIKEMRQQIEGNRE